MKKCTRIFVFLFWLGCLKSSQFGLVLPLQAFGHFQCVNVEGEGFKDLIASSRFFIWALASVYLPDVIACDNKSQAFPLCNFILVMVVY